MENSMAILARATILMAPTSKASSRQTRLTSANQAEEITRTHRVLQTNLDPGLTTFRISASLRKEAPRGTLQQRSMLEKRARSDVATKGIMKYLFQTISPWREAVPVPPRDIMSCALHLLGHSMIDRLPCHSRTPRSPRLRPLIKMQSLLIPLRTDLTKASSTIRRARRTVVRRKREVTDYHTDPQAPTRPSSTSNRVDHSTLSSFTMQ
jgi:hypothetical protein